MEYKILITLFVPEIEKQYELYIPINKPVYYVEKMLNELIRENMLGNFPIKAVIHLCNRRTGQIYKKDNYIRETDIRNGTELVLF